MPKRKKDKEPVPVMPQRYKWWAALKCDSYEAASLYVEEYPLPSGHLIKIKRRKNHFEVRQGTPI